jgi:hypothetical protein
MSVDRTPEKGQMVSVGSDDWLNQAAARHWRAGAKWKTRRIELEDG